MIQRMVPPEQVKAFNLVLCERLGIDPELVGERIGWEVIGGEDFARIDLTAFLPAQEVLDMWNGAARRT